MKRLKFKLCWWIAYKLPKRVALYAFVRVHALTMDAPAYEGEYSKAYKLWTSKNGIVET